MQNYTSYGEVTTTDGTPSSPFGFTGEQTDPNGLVYLRARYYDPATGVFMSRDPFEGTMQHPMSVNGYSWVEGNVVNAVDPDGMDPGTDTLQDHIGGGGNPLSQIGQIISYSAIAGGVILVAHNGRYVVEEASEWFIAQVTMGLLYSRTCYAGLCTFTLPNGSRFDLTSQQQQQALEAGMTFQEFHSTLQSGGMWPNPFNSDDPLATLSDLLDAQEIAEICNENLCGATVEYIINMVTGSSSGSSSEANEGEDVTSLPRYGDCTRAQHNRLQNDVNQRCKKNPTRCTSSMRCRELRSRRRRNRLCAEARERINRRCYRGGNEGHQQAAESYRNAFDICNEIFQNKCS